MFDPEGKFLAQWKEGGRRTGSSSPPTGLFVADGRADRVTVLDRTARRFRAWARRGRPRPVRDADMLCVDSRGDVYVAEINGKRVQKFTAK